MTSSFQIVSAETFRPQGEDVQLPSQRGTDQCVRLRRPDLVGLLAAGDGDVPDVLSSMILSMIQDDGGKAKAQQLKITAETLPQVMQSLDVLAAATFESPRVVREAEPPDGAVSTQWLSMADKAFVFEWALGGAQAAAVQSFPEKPAGRAGAVSAVQGVPSAPQRRARNKR